jgi:hypothetical protein
MSIFMEQEPNNVCAKPYPFGRDCTAIEIRKVNENC